MNWHSRVIEGRPRTSRNVGWWRKHLAASPMRTCKNEETEKEPIPSLEEPSAEELSVAVVALGSLWEEHDTEAEGIP